MLSPLCPGDLIHAVAPSSPFDRDTFEAGLTWLRSRYEVIADPGIFARLGYLAGDDDRRVAELRAALEDPRCRAVVCARGGFGATRLLTRLDPEPLRDRWLVGFSDITALHALAATVGAASVHGPMLASLGEADAATRRRWIRALEGDSIRLEGTASVPGIARAPLIGGNLAVLHALLGTPYMPPLQNAVLLIEDVGERPYRLDRMLTSLRQAGWLGRVAGVAVGGFTRCDPGPDGVTAAAVLADHLGNLGVPVVTGLPIGHGERNEAIRLGVTTLLDGGRGTLEQPGIR